MFNFLSNFGWNPIAAAPATSTEDDSWIVVNQDCTHLDSEMSTDARGNRQENMLLELPSFTPPLEETSGRSSATLPTEAESTHGQTIFQPSDFPPLVNTNNTTTTTSAQQAAPPRSARSLLSALIAAPPTKPSTKVQAPRGQPKAVFRNKQRSGR
eukprot:m.226727 g.226727  ORF g.226727 m.226727 type:complete len:155 (-) comp17019_c0_seq1:2157-2621(-)